MAKQLTSSNNEPTSMEELLSSTGYKLKTFTRGEKIKAKLLRINEKSANFDIGGKSEGVVADIYFIEAKKLIENLKPGEEVWAVVAEPENREGATLLSLRGAAQDDFWKKMEKAYKENETLEVMVKSVSAHGLVVSLETETAFVPNSQLSAEISEKGEDVVGTRIKTKILDIDQANARIVLSERAVSEAKDIEKQSKALGSVNEGDIYDGIVKSVTHFGAFVEIELDEVVVEGLVHVSELAWTKVERPEDVLKIGDKVKVKVLGLDKGKLSLSMKQAGKDPWERLEDKYAPDDKVKGKVVRVSDFGVFVEIEPGVEGLIHITKIPPATSIKEGDSVNCYIEEINKEERRMSLGIAVTSSKPVGYK